MNKQDIDKAASALTGAINYFSPISVALNQANEVFSVLSNALKLKTVIEREVETLQSSVETYRVEVEKSKTAILENTVFAEQAKAQALKDVADAKDKADAEVKSVKASVAERTKKAVSDSEAKILEVAKATEAAQAAHATTVAQLNATKVELEANVAALETKLAALKAQAQKFAASLVE